MEPNDAKVEISEEDTKHEDIAQDVLDSDQTDWKAKALELQGIAKRRATQLAKAKERLAAVPEKPEAKPQDKPRKKSDELDYTHLAFHNSKSNTLKIESEEEIEWVKQQLEETGKPLQGLLNSKYFQTEYKSFKDSKAVDDSVPNVKGRSNQPSASRSLEYWMNRGDELPEDTYENKQLILDIVDARYKKAKEGR